MVDTPFSKYAEAGALIGDEVGLISQRSATITITAATISALASDNSYNDSANGFVAAGFAVDDYVTATGFTGDTANNIFSAKITALTAGKMTIGGSDGNVIVDDAAGESVTITKWVSRRRPVSATPGGWALVSTTTISSPVAQVDVTGLTGTEILVVTRLVTRSVSGVTALQVSVDNGSNFYSASGDYVLVPTSGAESAQTFFAAFHTTNSTAARSGAVYLPAAGVNGGPKSSDCFTAGDGLSRFFVASTSPINAIRIIPSLGGNLNAGDIYVYTR